MWQVLRSNGHGDFSDWGYVTIRGQLQTVIQSVQGWFDNTKLNRIGEVKLFWINTNSLKV